MFANRSSFWIFWCGCLSVTAGVLLHLPMFFSLVAMSRPGMDGMAGMDSHAAKMGMAQDPAMITGMSLIVLGILLTAYGLFPRKRHADVVPPPKPAPTATGIGGPQLSLMVVLVIALIVDTMKPATIGFVLPGISKEYGITRAQASWLPFLALTGTAVGSMAWGVLCDFYGRRAAILLATVVFIGTSICGAMPTFGWNLTMCFLMGASAGGLLPVTYALLTETLPARSRGWALVLVGGLGSAGGYVAASGAAALLEPAFTWRSLWLLGLPTGLTLVLLNRFIPESPDFLQGRGAALHVERPPRQPLPLKVMLLLAALTLVGLAWGLVNFGLLLWLPTELVARGRDLQGMSSLISKGAILGVPVVMFAAYTYARWSAKWTLIAAMAVTLAGLCGLLALDAPRLARLGPLITVSLLVMGANGVIATVLPYASERTPAAIRGRATGWVAGSSKTGGILAQILGLIGLSPGLGPAALVTGVLLALSAVLVAFSGRRRPRSGPLAFDPAP